MRVARDPRPALARHSSSARSSRSTRVAASVRAPGLAPTHRSVEVVVEDVPAPARVSRIVRFCAQVLKAAGFSEWDVAVLLCRDARIKDLNLRYRGKPAPTDVLSFPRDAGRKGDPVRGDIAVSVETLSRNAARFGTTEDDEMKRLLVHGLLHLAGMDHGQGKSGRMLALQERLLTELDSGMIYPGRGVRK